MVINYEVPNDAEDYVHRIGRTARADRKGEAITYINKEQSYKFKKIEDLIEKVLEKEKLPQGFDTPPEYNSIKPKSKRYKSRKKRKFNNQKNTQNKKQ